MGKDCESSCDPCAPAERAWAQDATTSSNDEQVIVRDLYAQAVSPILTGDQARGAGVQITPAELGATVMYATLDGNYGTTRLVMRSKLGIVTLSHGKPVPVQGPGATVWLTGADRTSIAFIRLSSSPIFLGPMRFREVGRSPLTSETVAGGAVPLAGLVLHHDGVSIPTYQVRAGNALVDFELLELVDPGDGGAVFTKPAASTSLTANEVDSLSHQGTSTAYIAYFELVAGAIDGCAVRATQVIP